MKLIPKYLNGGYSDVDANVDTQNFEMLAYLENWLKERKPILRQNTLDTSSMNENPSKFWNRLFNKPKFVNDELNRLINSARNTRVYNENSPVLKREYLNSEDNRVFNKAKISDYNSTDNLKEIKNVATFLNNGHYRKGSNTIWVDYNTNNSTLLHEKTHSLDATPLEKKIQTIIRDKKDPYYDKSTEIYSRLMEFRMKNNLNPRKLYNMLDVKTMRQSSKDADLFNRYTDLEMLELLNDVASVKSTNNNLLNMIT